MGNWFLVRLGPVIGCTKIVFFARRQHTNLGRLLENKASYFIDGEDMDYKQYTYCNTRLIAVQMNKLTTTYLLLHPTSGWM